MCLLFIGQQRLSTWSVKFVRVPFGRVPMQIADKHQIFLGYFGFFLAITVVSTLCRSYTIGFVLPKLDYRFRHEKVVSDLGWF